MNATSPPFYDPHKTYYENFEQGPFGDFTNDDIVQTKRKLGYDFLGNKVDLPFGIAAGPLLNGKYIKAALQKGFDLVVYKTVRSHEYPCHNWPNIVEIDQDADLSLEKAVQGVYKKELSDNPKAITNSFGVPSFEPEFWQKDMQECIKFAQSGQLVIGSFQGTPNGEGNVQAYINDFAHTAQLVKETGVKVMEANLSCPNEGSGKLLCHDLDRTTQIVNQIRQVIGDTPLLLKIAYLEDQTYLEKFIHTLAPYVQGFCAINTIAAKIYDHSGEQALPGEGRLVSGVCGSPIRWAGLEMVKRIARIRESMASHFTIIGVGGVMNTEDYQTFIDAGADAVMCATGAMWNAYLAKEIKNAQGLL